MLYTPTESQGNRTESADTDASSIHGRLSHKNTQRKRLVQLTDASSVAKLREQLPALQALSGVLDAEIRAKGETVWVHYDLQHINLAQIEQWLTSHGARLPQLRSAQRIREAIHRVEAREQTTFQDETLQSFIPLH